MGIDSFSRQGQVGRDPGMVPYGSMWASSGADKWQEKDKGSADTALLSFLKSGMICGSIDADREMCGPL